MKILAIMQKICYPPRDGATQRQFNLLKKTAAGNSVHLLAFHQRTLHESDEELARGREMLLRYCEEVDFFPIPTENRPLRYGSLLVLNLFSRAPFPVQRHRSCEMRRAIRERLKRHNYDLVHIDATALAEYGAIAGGTPAILIHHNVESDLLRRRADGRAGLPARLYLRLQAWKLRRFETRVTPLFRVNVTVSDQDRSLLLGHCPGADVRVIRNGADTDALRPDPAAEADRRLIFVGSLNWSPNPDAVLYFLDRIWPLVKRDVPGVTFDVVGIAPPREIVDFARRDDSVRVHGFVDDLGAWLAKATVFVVPLRMGGGTRLKILDAMAMGKAIVSTRLGAEGLDLAAGEEIILEDEPELFARTIVRLINDPGLRQALGRRARERVVRDYSWDKIGRDLQCLYEEVAAGGRSRSVTS